MRLGLLLLALVLPAGRGSAQLELKVGRDAISWVEIQDSLSFVNVSTDSAWTWRVEPGENLMANVLGTGWENSACVNGRVSLSRGAGGRGRVSRGGSSCGYRRW